MESLRFPRDVSVRYAPAFPLNIIAVPAAKLNPAAFSTPPGRHMLAHKGGMRMTQSKARVSSVTVRGRATLAQVTRPERAEAAGAPQNEPQSPSAKKLRFGERMLRNTAIATALLLCAVAAKTAGVAPEDSLLSRAVTMDLSESLGGLKFVSNLLPESARVFWNLGQERHSAPSVAAMTHEYSAAEPYLAYSEGEALASADGEVMSVARDAVGRSTVRLRHDSGMETLYGNLIAASVREGDRVKAGQVLGVSRALLYEMRAEGLPTDPAPYLQ